VQVVAASVVVLLLAVVVSALVAERAAAGPKTARAAHGGVFWKVERVPLAVASVDVFNASAPDKGVYSVCQIGDAGEDGSRIVLSRLGPGKRVHWTRRVGSWPADDVFARPCVSDSRGNVYVLGERLTSKASYMLVAKYDKNGRRRWLRSTIPAGLGGFLTADSAVLGRDTLYVAVSGLSHTGKSIGKVVALAADTGREKWSTPIVAKPRSGSMCNGVTVDPAGNLYAVGIKDVSRRQSYCMSKITALGRRVWSRSWKVPAGSDGVGRQAIAFGGETAFAVVSLGIDEDWYPRLAAVRGSGAGAWTHSLGIHHKPAIVSGLVCDQAGNVYVAGETEVDGPEDARAFLQRWSPAGRRAWVRTYYDSKAKEPAMILDLAIRGRSLYCAGWQFSSEDDASTLALRVTTGGVTRWKRTWSAAGKLNAAAWAVTPVRGAVYLSGAVSSLDRMPDEGSGVIWKLRP
jgi:outer membrane protein assembly factor BamB